MLRKNLPLNRDTWMALNYFGEEPEGDQWTAQHEAEVPKPFQNPDLLRAEPGPAD